MVSQDDQVEAIHSENEHKRKKNHNGCIIFNDSKPWCHQDKGLLVHVTHLQPPKVTLDGMRTAKLLDKMDIVDLLKVLNHNLSNFKVDNAVTEMVISCDHSEHFAAIDALVSHLSDGKKRQKLHCLRCEN